MAIVNGQWVEQGVPPEFVDRGARTVAQYQQMAASDLSDRQIQAQRDIATQQQEFNQQQVNQQQAQYEQQQTQAREQAARQTEYDTGRASQLADATSQIDSAFSQFYSPRTVVTGPAPGGPPRPMPTAPAETGPFTVNVTQGPDGQKTVGPLPQGQQDAVAAAQKYQADATGAKQDLFDPAHQPATTTYSDYFDQFAHDYTSRAQDQVSYQQRQAERDLGFQLARQGISASQARANQEGLIQETAGRTMAEQVDAAQNAAANLRSNVASARQNLLGQVINAQSIGSPIAGSTEQDVGNALQTQRSAISGITNTAGDTVASLNAVPVVNTLSNIFGSVLGSAGSFVQGANANAIMGQFGRGFAGTDPGATSTRLG
jgi:hypothetical protein